MSRPLHHLTSYSAVDGDVPARNVLKDPVISRRGAPDAVFGLQSVDRRHKGKMLQRTNGAGDELDVPVEGVLRAPTLSETRGFLKALVETDGDRILGFTAFRMDGGEIMSAVQIAMIAELPYTKLRDVVLTHPTSMEGLIPLFASASSVVARTANASTQPPSGCDSVRGSYTEGEHHANISR